MSGIYIHIPFCKKKCTYCNFHFSTNYQSYRNELLNAILDEIKMRKDYLEDKEIKSIYLGGGTPSLLTIDELSSIIAQLKVYYIFDISTIEFTLEANPDDLTINKLKGLKSIGINRLSIGIQSFHEDDLIFMNRSHNLQQAESCIRDSQSIGFDNISIDLIFGLPNSTMKKWQYNLDKATQLNIAHLSVYNLTVEPKTALQHQVSKNLTTIATDEQASQQFYQAKKHLEANGYIHYETSNYAKKGYIAQHNSSYWKSQKYIGLGPGAHSYNGKSRQWNISNNNIYIKQITKNILPYEEEHLTPSERYNEYIITSLRTMWGSDWKLIQTYDKKFQTHFLEQTKKHIYLNNLKLKNNYYILTKQGLIFTDLISSDLMI